MFFVLATTGVLLLLVMYAVTDLAAVRRLRRSGAGVGATLLPLGGAAVAAIVLVQGLRSAPAGLALVVTRVADSQRRVRNPAWGSPRHVPDEVIAVRRSGANGTFART